MKTREELVAEENKNSSEFYPAPNHDSDKTTEHVGLPKEDLEVAHKKWKEVIEPLFKEDTSTESNFGTMIEELESTLTKRELAFLVVSTTAKLFKLKAQMQMTMMLSGMFRG